jgi:hypothetical protein
MATFDRRQGAAHAEVWPPPENLPPGDRSLISAYRFLQLMVGAIAVLLPVITVLPVVIYDGGALRGSISAYYYTRMGGYFVGSMCALGVIFASYRHNPEPEYVCDNRLSNIAGVLAVVVALVPTSIGAHPTGWSWVARTVHLTSAAVLLFILAYLAYYRFTLPKDSDAKSQTKHRQNQVYRWSGRIIVIGLAGIAIANLLDADPWLPLVSESIAVIAFGVAWLVKSESFRPIAALKAARA